MDSKTKFRIINTDDAYAKVSSAEEGFIVSRMRDKWITGETLLSECPSFDENKFYNLMRVLVKKGVVESDVSEKRTVQTQEKQEITKPFERRYPSLDISPKILENLPKSISEECMKEIIFLSEYGDSIDLYRRLGLQDNPFESSIGLIRERTIKYNTFFKQIKKECSKSTTLFQAVFEHLDAAEDAIAATKILLDKEEREAYNQQLRNKGSYVNRTESEVPRDELHYNAAVAAIETQKHSTAKNEITLALHLNSRKQEYLDLEKKIAILLDKDAAKLLLVKLKKNESLLWDERVMRSTLKELFALDNSVDMHISAARVLANKNAFQIAMEVLNDAGDADAKTQEEIDALSSDIKKRYKVYKKKF